MAREREESQGFFEMLWDCEFCDARGLLGKSQRHCANCGAPQNPDKRYFPRDGEARRVDGHIYEGADRHCPACQAPQGARAHNCTRCGAPLDGAAEVRGVMGQAGPGGGPGIRAAAAATTAPRRRRWIWLVVLAAVALAGAGIWWRFLRTREAQVTVAGHAWERSVAIEEFNERQEEAWRDQVPAGAGLPVCHERERSTRQVEDGEECTTEKRDKKDGTFEQVEKCRPKYRSEPVMDSWCRFTMRRWKQVDTIKSSGRGTTAAWPANLPAGDTRAALGARRQGKRTETRILDFGPNGTCDVSEAVWKKYADGQSIKTQVRASSGAVVCGSL